jgi:hypothetical protein
VARQIATIRYKTANNRVVFNDGFWRIVLKNSKNGCSENLANVACWRFQPLQGSVESIRAPAVVFAAIDVVPQVAARETHQRSSEISVIREKGLFQHNPPKAAVLAEIRPGDFGGATVVRKFGDVPDDLSALLC